MIGKPKGVDVHVESRARDHARWAIRDHGDDAEAVLKEKMARPSTSQANRYLYKLTLREIARLRRERPEKYGSSRPSPGLFSKFFS